MTNFFAADNITFAGIFCVGLLISVYAMINGSIKPTVDPSKIKPPPAAFNLFVIGAAITCFGIVGYLVATYSQFDTNRVLVAASVAGLIGWVGMSILMGKWAFSGPLNDPHEDMEELQGTVAIVTKDITPDHFGEISYIFRGETLTAPAQCISGAIVAAGTEVVIDVVENGLAQIEIWEIVEERINGVAH